jgi:protein-S-isoprenylcysteine O-methyltransferase Ste14
LRIEDLRLKINPFKLLNIQLKIFNLLGEAVLFATLLILGYTIFFFFCFHLFVVAYEEPALRGTFGAAYKRYYDTVPRWLPRFDMWSKLC